MKIPAVLGIVILLSHLSIAQGNVTGTIKDDKTGERLAGATVTLEGIGANVIADELGGFRINNIEPGTYALLVSFVGYESYRRVIRVDDEQTTNSDITLKTGNIQLSDVTVTAGETNINTLTPLDMRLRPANTSQDLLRMVPGLFIAQHAGGGKAEQIFLRGFDIDHGTDINLEVDGLPVNMVSHAHGQGYSDLHFVIPELIQRVDFNKGPYYASKGDFTTAGYVDFQTKNRLDENFAKMEGGQFGTVRAVAGVNIPNAMKSKTTGYVASEFFRTNGYVESPQNFARFNIASKLSRPFGDRDVVTGLLSFFKSRWNASGQIPSRAVEERIITRWGSIDDTEGGETMRANFSLKHVHQFTNGSYLEQQLYTSLCDFNLYSNFTFFLNDPIHGDQIRQSESRTIYGYKTSYIHTGSLFGKVLNGEAGAGLRSDDISGIRLSHTRKRSFINDIKLGHILESNLNAYISETIDLTDQLSVNASVRFDFLRFTYQDRLMNTDKSVVKCITSPKLRMDYQLSSSTELYLRSGLGFHSNDARVVTGKEGVDILPRAYGFDLGANSKITNHILLNVAVWYLGLAEEFVYVGDEGIVEPSGETVREGVDFSIRYQALDWLFLDADVNITRPRARDIARNEGYIPLAPRLSSIGGFTFRFKNGFNGSLRYRYLGDRPANEDNTVIARGYFLSDAILNFTRRTFEVGISAENIFNRKWNEAQFDTESRLQNETDPVSEIHFTPGTPFFAKIKMTIFF